MGASASVKAEGRIISRGSHTALEEEEAQYADLAEFQEEATFKDLNAALMEQMELPLNAADIETAEDGREQLKRIRFLLKCFVPLQCESVEEVQALVKDGRSATAVVRNEAVALPRGSFLRQDHEERKQERFTGVDPQTVRAPSMEFG